MSAVVCRLYRKDINAVLLALQSIIYRQNVVTTKYCQNKRFLSHRTVIFRSHVIRLVRVNVKVRVNG